MTIESKQLHAGTFFINNRGHEYKIICDEYTVRNTKGKAMLVADIIFSNSGTEMTAHKGNILKGNVKDPYAKDVQGVACRGNAKKIGNEKVYQIWMSMIQRCYNSNATSYKQYGAKGVFIEKRWLCFEYFLEDISKIEGYDEKRFFNGELHIDKDMKCEAMNLTPKRYSLDTCTFVPVFDNLSYQKGKKRDRKENIPLLVATNVETGDKEYVYNISRYAIDNGFNLRAIRYRITKHVKKPHKGFIFERINYYNVKK